MTLFCSNLCDDELYASYLALVFLDFLASHACVDRSLFESEFDTDDNLFLVEGDLGVALFVHGFLTKHYLFLYVRRFFVLNYAELNTFFVCEYNLIIEEAAILLVLEPNGANSLMEIELVDVRLHFPILFHLAMLENWTRAKLTF